jgi:hypothetical protein
MTEMRLTADEVWSVIDDQVIDALADAFKRKYKLAHSEAELVWAQIDEQIGAQVSPFDLEVRV